MKRLIRMILSRTSLILLLLLIQIILLYFAVIYISKIGYWQSVFYAISVIIVIYMIAKEENPIYKLSWIIPILLLPVFGGFFYLFYKRRNVSSKVLKRHLLIDQSRSDYIKDIQTDIQDKDEHYLLNQHFPTYEHTKTTFLGSGEAMFEAMKKDMLMAEKYIFLEFFIISRGQMWDEVLHILKEKAQAGVEVKLIYDDFGSSQLPFNYVKKLKSYGIDAMVFNPMKIHLNFAMNYRDHRKIVIIDGKVAYTGGTNIGDEYINLISPFGHWLDAGIRIEGQAVWSLVITFLENHRFSRKTEIGYKAYKVEHQMPTDGHVTPFSDTPLDNELITKNIYLSLMMSAQKSIKITTPYLIIDNELLTALKFLAKAGVEVDIIIPYVPDKKFVFMVTESYVPELVKAGVNVYHYIPGFIHSKMMVIDEKKALIGTANLDFRSLYLHFENSIYLNQTSSIKDMTAFFKATKEKSVCVTKLEKRSFFYKLVSMLLKSFASLM